VNTVAAFADVRGKLSRLDDREARCALRPLAEQDLTWQERIDELRARIVLLMADGPTQDVLDALGAHVIAFKIALAAAEEVRVDTGEAA
jgi:hypothetical protein